MSNYCVGHSPKFEELNVRENVPLFFSFLFFKIRKFSLYYKCCGRRMKIYAPKIVDLKCTVCGREEKNYQPYYPSYHCENCGKRYRGYSD